MHKFIAFIAAAFAMLGALSIALMFYGHFNEGGMAVLAFQLWGVIASVAALVLGFLARVLSKGLPTPSAAKFAMGLGAISLLALILGFVILG